MYNGLAGAVETGLPQLRVLLGETGRGKSFAIQNFYDRLAQERPGYWLPGLRPEWPPASVSGLRKQRKTVTPARSLRRPTEKMPFLWLSVSCSGSPDAPRLDPTGHFLGQLWELVGEAVAAQEQQAEKRRWIAERTLEGVGQLEPVFSTVKFIIETVLEGFEIFGSTSSATSQALNRVTEALREFASAMRRLGVEPPPLVVVVDDASAAPEELWRVIGALIAEPQTGSAGQDSSHYLPTSLDQFPPLPILIVASAWPHATSYKGPLTPFDHWQSEFQDLGLNRVSLTCREFVVSEAQSMLDEWVHGPDRELRSQLVNHLAEHHHSGLVNPLVLAENVAWLEDRRNPFTAELGVSAEIIAGLNTSPQHHIQERIEAVRSDGLGREASELLAMAASIATAVPWAVFVKLHRASGSRHAISDLFERLIEHRVLRLNRAAEGLPNALDSVTIDADIHDYFQLIPRRPGAAAVVHATCELLLTSWAELERDSLLNGMIAPVSLRRGQFLPIAMRLDSTSSSPRATVLAESLRRVPRNERAHAPDDVRASELALMWVLDGFESKATTKQLLSGIAELGVATIAMDALRGVLASKELEGSPELRDVLDGLSAHANLPEVQTVVVAAWRALGDVDAAREAVDAHALVPQAALDIAAGIAERGTKAEAREFLKRWRDNPNIRFRIAVLTADIDGPEAALELISPETTSWTEANLRSDLLLRSNRTAERSTLLMTWAKRNPSAAIELAGDLETDGKIDAARKVLAPWAGSFASAANRLALLEWGAGHHMHALGVLAKFGLEGSATAPALLKILNEVAESGIRFRPGHDGRLEAIRCASRPRPHSMTNTFAAEEADALASEVRSAVDRSGSPDEAAGAILTALGPGKNVRDAVQNVLLPGNAITDSFDGEVAFHFLSGSGLVSEGMACRLADLAFALNLPDAPEQAARILRRYQRSTMPSVVGRLMGLQILVGEVDLAAGRMAPLSEHNLWFAFVGIARMLGARPSIERSAWERLSRELIDSDSHTTLKQAAPFVAGRLLPIERALGPQAPQRIVLLEELLPPTAEVVTFVQQATDRFLTQPDAVPRLVEYQVLSLYEYLAAVGRAPEDLANRLAEGLAADPPIGQLELMRGWAGLSTVAAIVVQARIRPGT